VLIERVIAYLKLMKCLEVYIECLHVVIEYL